MHLWLTLSSAATALLAAFFWFLSAMVPYPSELVGHVFYGGTATVVTRPLVDAARKTAWRNKIAASFAAAAAVSMAADAIWPLIPLAYIP